jgi:hypothetical protein
LYVYIYGERIRRRPDMEPWITHDSGARRVAMFSKKRWQ